MSFQVCHCGSQPGYPHAAFCPFPLFTEAPARVTDWTHRAALLASADLIERLDGQPADLGQGADLSRIPPAQGYHFPDWLRAIAKETP